MSLSRIFLPVGKDPRNTNELIIRLKNEFLSLEKEKKGFLHELTTSFIDPDHKKTVCKLLKEIKEMIYGSITSEPEPEKIRAQLVYELYKRDLLLLFIEYLPNIAFDGRKDIALIYEYAIGEQIGTRTPTVQYVRSKPQIIELLIKYYRNEELVTICGHILREFLRFECLAKRIFKLKDEFKQKLYFNFFDYVRSDSFAVSSDVFATIRELFVRHKDLAKQVLITDYLVFFQEMNELLISDNYYIRRKSVKLLSDILYDRNNELVMKQYINSSNSLSIMKTIMESQCIHTSYDGFLVFYLFIVNKSKSSAIKEILMANKDFLIDFINKFQTNRNIIERYSYDREVMVQCLNELK